MPVNIEITDRHIIVKAENGDTIVLNKEDGQPSTSPTKARTTPRTPKVTLSQVKISPRWIAHVGDTVLAQHKPGGRKFRTTIRAFKVEGGMPYAQVADPRNGGTYLLALDRLTRTRS